MPRSLIVMADGGSRGNPGQAAYGAVVFEGSKVLAEVSGKIGVATNNVAEYRGLIAGLEAAHEIDPQARIEVRLDSKLVVEQMSGKWKIRHPEMRELALEAKKIHPHELLEFMWIPREENSHADRLVNEALDGIIATAKEPIQLNYLTDRLISNEVPGSSWRDSFNSTSKIFGRWRSQSWTHGKRSNGSRASSERDCKSCT
jgi:ribonuclease HI